MRRIFGLFSGSRGALRLICILVCTAILAACVLVGSGFSVLPIHKRASIILHTEAGGASAQSAAVLKVFTNSENAARVPVSVFVDTAGVSANAVDGVLTYPANKLKIESISTQGSIITFWVEKPQASAKDGTIRFSGVVPNPGYTGARGLVFSVEFSAIGEGDASIGVTQAHVLANDGVGTDVLTAVLPGVMTLVKPTIKNTDLNGDGAVTLSDLSMLVSALGSKEKPAYDLDGNGTVNLKDLSILAAKLTR